MTVRLASLVAAVFAPLLLAATADAHLLWRVSDPARPDSRAFVLATVALSQQDQLAFDPSVIEAFEASQRLVLPNSAVLSKQNALIGWKAHLTEGDNLRNWLSLELMTRYVEAVGLAGYPATFADVTAPWFAARMVRRADLERNGFAREREFEVYFTHLAQERAEPIEILPLEDSATSYDRAAALSPEAQTELMARALEDSARASANLPAAAMAWKRGDLGGLDAVLRDTDAQENQLLADALERLVAEPGAHSDFLPVDARFLLGENGVLRELRARGLNVEAVSSTGGIAAPYPSPALPPAPRTDTDRKGRVLLVGTDAASLRIVTPMIEAGRLPNLAAIARQGASGPLRSHRPIYSPRIWNSIATGKTPAHHGIEGFTFKDAAGAQRLYLSTHRNVHALWNIASTAQLRVGVVNWWNTYPPEVVNGVMVSDHAKPTRLSELRKLTGAETLENSETATVYPAPWQARVAEVYGHRLVIPDTRDPFLGNLGMADWMKKEELSKRFRDDAAAARIALAVEAELAPDLMMVFLPGIDRVSHRLWGAVEPPDAYPKPLAMSPRQREAGREALEAYYDYTDALIGLLARGYGSDDLVMVVSDHGFEAGEHLGELTGVHDGEAALDGILFARGPGIAPGSSTKGTSVNDVTPTILAWLGLPIASDMDGRVAAFLTPSRTVEKIATHDVGEIERIATAPSGSEDEILDQLRALGYID
jgi:uncharacterized protein YbaP (TraB family)